MRIGVVLEENTGMEADVCAHFGQCKYFFIVDVDKDKKKILGTKIVPNTASHGGGGCVAVDEILKHNVTHVISGGMGVGAQQKFAGKGVRVFGYSGNVRSAVNDLLKDQLGGLSACKEHGHGDGCH